MPAQLVIIFCPGIESQIKRVVNFTLCLLINEKYIKVANHNHLREKSSLCVDETSCKGEQYEIVFSGWLT